MDTTQKAEHPTRHQAPRSMYASYPERTEAWKTQRGEMSRYKESRGTIYFVAGTWKLNIRRDLRQPPMTLYSISTISSTAPHSSTHLDRETPSPKPPHLNKVFDPHHPHTLPLPLSILKPYIPIQEPHALSASHAIQLANTYTPTNLHTQTHTTHIFSQPHPPFPLALADPRADRP